MKKILMGIITFIIICFSVWFQINVLNAVPLSGVKANFGIIFVAGIALISGKLIGGVSGAVYGLILDITLGRSIGTYIALYTLIGIIVGILNKNFSKGSRISMIMVILISTCIFETMSYLLNIILNSFELSFAVLIKTLFLECTYNALLVVLFFKPLCYLGDILNRCKNSFYLL